MLDDNNSLVARDTMNLIEPSQFIRKNKIGKTGKQNKLKYFELKTRNIIFY